MPKAVETDITKKEIVKICYVFHGEAIYLPPDTFPGKAFTSTYDHIDKLSDWMMGNN